LGFAVRPLPTKCMSRCLRLFREQFVIVTTRPEKFDIEPQARVVFVFPLLIGGGQIHQQCWRFECYFKNRVDREQKHRLAFTAINILLVVSAVYLANRMVPSAGPKEVSYDEFLAELRADHLSEVQITERQLIGVLKPDPAHPKSTAERTIKTSRLPGVDEAELLKELEAHPVKFTGHIDTSSGFWSLLVWMLPLLFIVFIYTVAQ